MAEETNSRLNISLPRYDGPFDLLLAMIRRNEWSIDDLPVAEITRQFLAYIRVANEIDAELGGEFVDVASWLVLLQSRSLLPCSGPEGPSLREELRRAVLDAATLASATEFLRDRGGNPRHGSGGAPIGRRDAVLEHSTENPTVEDVLAAAHKALEAARAAASIDNTDPRNTSVVHQAQWILDMLRNLAPGAPTSTSEWFATQPGGIARAALFLALLELARQGILLLHQSEPFFPVRVKTTGQISAEMEIPAWVDDRTDVVAN